VFAPTASEDAVTVICTVPIVPPLVASTAAEIDPVPIVAPPTVSVTVPVGAVAELDGFGVTVAVMVNVPWVTLASLEDAVVAVAACTTVKATGPAALAFRLLSPE